jgi:hypothetical protein
MMVLPGAVAVPFAHEAFFEAGSGLKDTSAQAALEDLAERVVHFARAMREYAALAG